MDQLQAIKVSNAILDTYITEIITYFSKNGFVNIEDTIRRYNPITYEYNTLKDDELNHYINQSMQFKWVGIQDNKIISRLKNELPQITQREANNFKKYIVNYERETQMNMIKKELEPYLKDYEQYKSRQTSIKGVDDIENQVIILKQNNILADHETNQLYIYKDGKISRINHSSEISKLFNDYLEQGVNIIPYYKVKNNKRDYIKNLPNIHKIIMMIYEITDDNFSVNFRVDNNQSITADCERDYNKILKLIKTYERVVYDERN